jgi:protoheme IX farnesyltransferase
LRIGEDFRDLRLNLTHIALTASVAHCGEIGRLDLRQIMSSQTLKNAPVRPSFWRKAKAYLALTKPRVIELLLIATVPTMILAQRGIPDPWLVIATVFGGALSAGSANSFNCYIDRDIDKVMGRTKSRPLVTGELSAKEAYLFAWALGILSVAWLAVLVNLLAAALSLAAILFYVFVYTLLLKRRTPQNIVWGGAAGAMPVLIGWAAVTGELSAEAWILFLIVFLWTPPHYWPLSLRYRTEYSDAGVPMLPVVRNNKTVGFQIVLYAWALVASTLLLIPIGEMGIIYSATALLMGALFILESHRLNNEASKGEIKNPMRLFHGSITYLTILFVAIALDPLLFFNLF